MTRVCEVVDTVFTDKRYAIPDALICKISTADPIFGTDCVWKLGADSVWVVGTPALNDGACPPAPPPVSWINSAFFNTDFTAPSRPFELWGGGGVHVAPLDSGNWTRLSSGLSFIGDGIDMNGTGKFYYALSWTQSGVPGDPTGNATQLILTAPDVNGPWSVSPFQIITRPWWIFQTSDGIFLISYPDGLYKTTITNGVWAALTKITSPNLGKFVEITGVSGVSIVGINCGSSDGEGDIYTSSHPYTTWTKVDAAAAYKVYQLQYQPSTPVSATPGTPAAVAAANGNFIWITNANPAGSWSRDQTIMSISSTLEGTRTQVNSFVGAASMVERQDGMVYLQHQRLRKVYKVPRINFTGTPWVQMGGDGRDGYGVAYNGKKMFTELRTYNATYR
jgi:hypothetical protein